jgi:hypothetical protein
MTILRTIRIQGLSALGLSTGLLLVISSQPAIILAAGLQSMIVFWALLWALSKSNRAFFSVFVGDALLRAVGLGIVAYWAWSNQLPYTSPLLTLAFAYLLFSFVQIPFFCRVR